MERPFSTNQADLELQAAELGMYARTLYRTEETESYVLEGVRIVNGWENYS